MKVWALSAGLMTAITLAACQQPAEKSATETAAPPAGHATSSAPASAPVNLTDPSVLSQAFQAAWDKAPPATSPAPEQSGGGQFTYRAGKLISLGGDRYAFVSDGNGEDGHVSPGAIAVHYLTRTADGFRRVDAVPLVYDGGTFGNPPEWTVRTDLGSNPVIQTESGGTWQGYTCMGADLIELAPQRPIQRTDIVRLYYSSGGARPDDAEELKGTLVKGDAPGTFKVQYIGAMNRTVTWRQGSDGAFKPVDEPADLPWC